MKGLMTLNPLPPKSDQHLTSPYNISPESYTRVIRIMIKVLCEQTRELKYDFLDYV